MADSRDDVRTPPATPVSHVLSRLEDELRSGRGGEMTHAPLGFPLLDDVLGGGVRRGDLMLIGGTPGVGKTIATMQWARNLARQGQPVVYACYEHEEHDLFLRLLSMEVGELADASPEEIEKVRMRLDEVASTEGRGLADLFSDAGLADQVRQRVATYGENLRLVRASGAHTGLAELDALVRAVDRPDTVLFVDYLQKVSVRPEPPTEAEKVTRVVEGLKDMALRLEVPIICVVAADLEGLKVRRMRIHHFRGSSALLYETDVAIVLNEKVNAVSKVHLAYDPLRAGTFRDQVIFSIEKNRGGPNRLDLEFRKDFAHFRFDPEGAIVTDRLVDERLESDES